MTTNTAIIQYHVHINSINKKQNKNSKSKILHNAIEEKTEFLPAGYEETLFSRKNKSWLKEIEKADEGITNKKCI